MAREINVVQGTTEWRAARLGIPTASQFKRILQPKKMQLSASANDYIYELVAEWVIGQPCDGFHGAFMERGTDMEDEAVRFYELETGLDTREVGFVVRDDGMVGCSPDRLIGNKGGLEIKVPSAQNHIKYLLDPDLLYEEYKLQVQGGLLISGRDWWDIESYNP